MARPKRVPYRPDRFQQKGRKVASWIQQREAAAIVAVVVAALGFALAAVFVTGRTANEEKALSALYSCRGDLRRLEAALAQYGSTSARPFTLLAIANISLEKPIDDEGRPKDETDAGRNERLGCAESALRTLVRDYPRHELHLYGLTLLGAVLEEEGEYGEAIEVLGRALEIAPATLEAKVRYDLGRLHVLMGRNDAARPYLLEARAKSSREIEIPSPHGTGFVRQKPAWFQNAEYLLARIGTGEKRIEFPEPEAEENPEADEKPEIEEKEKKPDAAESEKPPAEKSLEGAAAPEKDVTERTSAKEAAAHEAVPAEGEAGGEDAAGGAGAEGAAPGAGP